MKFDHPAPAQISQLLTLWKGAFGDYDGFWELFLGSGFAADRCRVLTAEGHICAALCWFDCLFRGQKTAYLYAVVTDPAYRGRGLCRALLEQVHDELRRAGYAAAVLVPAEEGLRAMYRKLGYRDATTVSEFSCDASEQPVALRVLDPEEYGRLRRTFLPRGGVLQEGENLTFLAAQAQLFAGEDLLLAAFADGDTLVGWELLGDPGAAPGILRALGFSRGWFRGPGGGKAFAMAHPLTEDAVLPEYFGFAFD